MTLRLIQRYWCKTNVSPVLYGRVVEKSRGSILFSPRRLVTSQKHRTYDPRSRSARNRSAETKHRTPDPAFNPPAPPSGSGGGAAGALLVAASSTFWRIRSASRGTLPRPRTRSWRYSQKLTPNRRHVFFKLAKVSRARRPESLRVLPLIFRFLT